MDIVEIGIYSILILGGITLMTTFVLRGRYINMIYREAFNKIGFSNISSTQSRQLKNFQFDILPASYNGVYSGHWLNQEAFGIYFVREGDANGMLHWVGLILKTKDTYPPLRIYDKKMDNVAEINLPKKTESVEFDKYFTIYSDNMESFYYHLSPSQMVNMLKLKELGTHPFSLQFADGQVLIFNYLNISISEYGLSQTINIILQRPDPKIVQGLADQITRQFDQYWDLLQSIGL